MTYRDAGHRNCTPDVDVEYNDAVAICHLIVAMDDVSIIRINIISIRCPR
jgi:hypothetical protein